MIAVVLVGLAVVAPIAALYLRLAWLTRPGGPSDPLTHDTDWHGQLDELRAELTDRRVLRDQLHADRAERGQTSGPQGE